MGPRFTTVHGRTAGSTIATAVHTEDSFLENVEEQEGSCEYSKVKEQKIRKEI